jgi:hypothetical protein
MFGSRVLAASLAVFAFVVIMSTSCGGGSGAKSVQLVWRPAQGEDIQVDFATNKAAPLFQTTVYVSNKTESTLRNARLRFQMDAARNAPAGFHVGTVAPISSKFEGGDQLWAMGDLAPGAHVAVNLGLWFDLETRASQSHPVELILALVSPDLSTAVESNTLRIRLGP